MAEAKRQAELAAQWEAERKTRETAMRLRAEAMRARAVAQRNKEREAKRKFRAQRDLERQQRRMLQKKLRSACRALDDMRSRLDSTETELQAVVRTPWSGLMLPATCCLPHCDWSQTDTYRNSIHAREFAIKACSRWQRRTQATVAWAYAGVEKVVDASKAAKQEAQREEARIAALEARIGHSMPRAKPSPEQVAAMELVQYSATGDAVFHGMEATEGDPYVTG